MWLTCWGKLPDAFQQPSWPSQECDPHGVPPLVASWDGAEAILVFSPDRSPSLTEDSLNSADPDLGTRFFFFMFHVFKLSLNMKWRWNIIFPVHCILVCINLFARLANWTCARVQEALEPSNVIPTCLFAMKDWWERWLRKFGRLVKKPVVFSNWSCAMYFHWEVFHFSDTKLLGVNQYDPFV